MVPRLNSDKPRRSSRRKVRDFPLLYAFIVVVAAATGLSYLKILVDMPALMASGGSTPTINGKPIHPGIGGRSAHAAKAAAAAKEGIGRVRSLPTTQPSATCAILLFGLPRAFKNFVLPSLEKNVVRPNARYGCDYFVHYYQQDHEAAGRSGRGGSIQAEDIFLLKDSVRAIFHDTHTNSTSTATALPSPTIAFVSDTNETFWDKRGDVIRRYRTTKNADGNYSFYPYGERTYEYPGTLDNIVRQWHSVNAVWDAMEAESSRKASDGNRNNKNRPHQYRRVAMMRNDVVYLTPIDIYSVPVAADANEAANAPHQTTDDYSTNARSVIPNFAKYPVNDRLIYGPHSAVEVWASQRFSRIEEYARDPSATPGMVMHSETFLNASILQTIREAGAPDQGKLDGVGVSGNNNNNNNHTHQPTLLEDPWMCFLRVRADGAIWIEDCDASKSGFGGGYPGGEASYTKLLREFLPNRGKGCKKRKLRDKVRRILELACPKRGV